MNFVRENEKTKILEYLDHNMAWEMLKLNDLLNFYLRESVIEWKLVSLYFKRNNFLTGVVF